MTNMKSVHTIIALICISTLLAFTPLMHGDGTYKVDVSKSSIEWVGKKFTGEHSGDLTLKSGEIVMGGHSIKSATFTIDMTTIKCTDLKGESAEDLESHLRNKDFFNTKKFPEATITMVSAAALTGDANGNNFTIQAKLTLKGITGDISFPALVTIGDKQVTLKAKVVFDRSKYNVTYRSTSIFDDLGDKFIYDDIDLNVTLVGILQ